MSHLLMSSVPNLHNTKILNISGMRWDMTKRKTPFFFTFKGLWNSPIFQYLNFSFHRHFKQNSFIFQFQGVVAFLTRGAWHDISASFSWIAITNAFNLMFAICLHVDRILEESFATSIQEVSWLSAVSEKSFCSFFLNFFVAVLVFKIHFRERMIPMSNVKLFCEVRLV